MTFVFQSLTALVALAVSSSLTTLSFSHFEAERHGSANVHLRRR